MANFIPNKDRLAMRGDDEYYTVGGMDQPVPVVDPAALAAAPREQVAPVQQPQMPMEQPVAAPSQSDVLEQYLRSMFDPAEMERKKEMNRQMQLASTIGRAGSGFANALTGRKGDDSYYDQLDQNMNRDEMNQQNLVRDYLKTKYDMGIREQTLGQQAAQQGVQNKFKERELDLKDKEIKAKGSVGHQAVDRAFAKNHVDWIGGGAAMAAASIDNLKSVADKLSKSSNLSGPIVGNTPAFIRSIINPDSIDTQQRVEGEIQKNLKATLGAQFTEKEGVMFMERGYNPKLDEKTNEKRVKGQMNMLQKMFEAKQAMSKYYSDNGSLRGYSGPDPVAIFHGFIGTSGESTSNIEPQTKQVNGVTYQKVEGGWKKVN